MTASITKPKRKYSFIPNSIKGPIYASWIILFLITLISTVYYFISQPELPIFYSLATKADFLAKKEFVFLFPAISLLMNLSHLPIIKVLKSYSNLMLKLFAFTTTTLQSIFLLALLRIVIITI